MTHRHFGHVVLAKARENFLSRTETEIVKHHHDRLLLGSGDLAVWFEGPDRIERHLSNFPSQIESEDGKQITDDSSHANPHIGNRHRVAMAGTGFTRAAAILSNRSSCGAPESALGLATSPL